MTEGTTSAVDAGPVAEAAGAADTLEARLEQEGEIAADYLEGLLDIADLDGDIDMDVEGDRALVSIVGDGNDRSLQRLVGQDGEVLEALQELTRLAVHRETGERSRLMLDIAGFRARKRAELAELGAKAAEQAKSTGESVKLRPMTPFERKVVHDAVARPVCAASRRARSPSAASSSWRADAGPRSRRVCTALDPVRLVRAGSLWLGPELAVDVSRETVLEGGSVESVSGEAEMATESAAADGVPEGSRPRRRWRGRSSATGSRRRSAMPSCWRRPGCSVA